MKTRFFGFFSFVSFLVSCTNLQSPILDRTALLSQETHINRDDLPPFPIIDAHIHTTFSGVEDAFSKIKDDESVLFQEMKSNGVVAAIAHTLPDGSDDRDLRSKNIFHCAGIEADVDVKRLDRGLREGRFRCIKIYLGYVYQYAYDPKYEPAYRLAEKYDVPVVFHAGDTSDAKAKLKFADPLTIDEVAVDHPKVKFVIAHIGNPWIQSAAEVAYKNPNVFLDGSALLVGIFDKLTDEQIDEQMVKPLKWVFNYVNDPTKLMYGSDWPLAQMKDYIRAFKRAIPEKDHRKVFYENAKNIFKLPLE